MQVSANPPCSLASEYSSAPDQWTDKRHTCCISAPRRIQQLLLMNSLCQHESSVASRGFIQRQPHPPPRWQVLLLSPLCLLPLFQTKYRRLFYYQAVCNLSKKKKKNGRARFALFNYNPPAAPPCSEVDGRQSVVLMHTFIFHLWSPFTVLSPSGYAYTSTQSYFVLFFHG